MDEVFEVRTAFTWFVNGVNFRMRHARSFVQSVVFLFRARKSDPELRQLTVLFCDLVGSTELAQRQDAEDLRDLILAYQDCCSRIVERFGGYVAQFLGDGVLAYFGYPKAYEHDARRAVEAGGLSLRTRL